MSGAVDNPSDICKYDYGAYKCSIIADIQVSKPLLDRRTRVRAGKLTFLDILDLVVCVSKTRRTIGVRRHIDVLGVVPQCLQFEKSPAGLKCLRPERSMNTACRIMRDSFSSLV